MLYGIHRASLRTTPPVGGGVLTISLRRNGRRIDNTIFDQCVLRGFALGLSC